MKLTLGLENFTFRQFVNMILFQELSPEERQNKEYVESLNKVVTHSNGVRVYEDLAAKIRSIRMNDIIVPPNLYAPKLQIQKSVPRPKRYDKDGKEIPFENNLFVWRDEINKEAKELINKNREFEEQEKEYLEKVKREKQNKALEESRKFFQEYGVLPKSNTQIAA